MKCELCHKITILINNNGLKKKILRQKSLESFEELGPRCVEKLK